MEAEIFIEIKEAEKKAEDILQRANSDGEKLVQDAKSKASSQLMHGTSSIDREKADKLQEFREKVYVLKDTKLSEGNEAISKLKEKSKKSMDATVKFINEKFLETLRE
ncbi:hypothetical protein HYX09_05015 [Candidatus Woesearchaeota archaeon]|nr:hypothetical protein [Candidatus Woesearchaeota archaeon]